jgi:alpha-beta hydrolase superfamily lysophospholipase
MSATAPAQFEIVPPGARAVVLIAHGLAEYSGRYRHAADAFAGSGIATSAYDQRGHGKSPGERTHVDHFDDFVSDLHEVLKQVHERHPQLPVFIWGHSMGALIVTLAALNPPIPLAGCITTSHPLNSFEGRGAQVAIASFVSRFAPHRRMDLKLDPRGLSHEETVQLAYANDRLVPKTATMKLLVEMMRACRRSKELAPQVKLPWLAVHGEEDPIAPVEGSRWLIEHLGSRDKRYVARPGLRHEIQNETPPAPAELFALMSEWMLERAQLS